MGTRPKILLLFAVLGIIPMVVLSVVNYQNGVRAVAERLRGEVEREAREIAHNVGDRLHEREDSMVALSRSRALRDYVGSKGKSPVNAESSLRPQPTASATPFINVSPQTARASTDESIPPEVQSEARAFLQSGQKYYLSVTCLDASRQPLLRAELNRSGDEPPVLFQTRDFPSESLLLDEHVWSTGERAPLRSKVTTKSFGSILRYTIPVFIEEENASAARGALIVDLNLDTLLADAAGNVAASSQMPGSGQAATHLVVVLDHEGDAVYHLNPMSKYQRLKESGSPSFKPVMEAMKEGQSGWRFYESMEGNDWIAAYEPLAPLELSVAAASNYSVAVRGLRFWGWLSIALIAFIGVVAALLLWLYLRRTARSIKRVTEGAVAIAKGKLDERIEVRSSDETRLLAETFNQMGDRLREQIVREAESRQFESFLRLSAMLTHDLKNSIQALSLIVGNMEQQFHREEFRMDAMQSLRDATSQLSALVAKLSEPVRSLSGEFKRPRPVDLVPIIRRALSRTAEQAAEMHEVEIQLPSQLVAVADDERIGKVVENLVLNAIEAMGMEKGRLSVTAGAAEEGFVFFSVCDTGPGMTEAFQRTRLFRPFSTTKPKGVGLGLYTCRELVRALGGRIEVESRRGSGTCFRVVLPSGAIAEASRKTAAPNDGCLSGKSFG
jgi:signal transduction histidine kinase